VILLLGRCGLERLAEPLRALGNEVQVAAWTQTDLVRRLEPDLVYVDLFDWDSVIPLVSAVLAGEAPQPDLSPLRAVVAALAGAPVVYRGLRPPPGGAFGLLASRPQRALEEALVALRSVVARERILDVAALWARGGFPTDQVAHGLGHGESHAGAAAEAGWLHALWIAKTRGPIKCLVVDLDETLIHGELVDEAFPARNPAYLPHGEEPQGTILEGFWRLKRGLHEALRVARSRGIVLAVATRNDPQVLDARWRKRPPIADGDAGLYAETYAGLDPEARARNFAAHPRVLDRLALGPEDFVIREAGFGAKSAACRRIAARLGVSLDALAFLDDSPFEREEVRQNAPGVCVLEGTPQEVRERLLTGAPFQVWEESPSAGLREASYRSRAAVLDAAEGEAALEEFLAGLELVVGVREALPGDLPRARELLQRTHQLDLTGRRPSLEEDLETLCAAGTRLYVGWCRDRVADHGVVALGVFKEGRLEAWVCSCRVLPHRVASTLLGEMLRREPGAAVERRETGRNAATLGLVEASAEPAPWVRVEA
jgi:FkbH-like protein